VLGSCSACVFGRVLPAPRLLRIVRRFLRSFSPIFAQSGQIWRRPLRCSNASHGKARAGQQALHGPLEWRSLVVVPRAGRHLPRFTVVAVNHVHRSRQSNALFAEVRPILAEAFAHDGVRRRRLCAATARRSSPFSHNRFRNMPFRKMRRLGNPLLHLGVFTAATVSQASNLHRLAAYRFLWRALKGRSFCLWRGMLARDRSSSK
jgi:hypothetical protein